MLTQLVNQITTRKSLGGPLVLRWVKRVSIQLDISSKGIGMMILTIFDNLGNTYIESTEY